MPDPLETRAVDVTKHEAALLELLRDEPQLVENLRRCTATKPHERSMLERLRQALILATGGAKQRAARPSSSSIPPRAD